MDDTTLQTPKLILLAHGSRDPNWCRTFEQGRSLINTYLEQDAALAYMEMAEPGLADMVRHYYQQGERRFQVLPLFFAAGRHLLVDVPRMLDELRASLPNLDIELREPVGQQAAFWHHLGNMIGTQPVT